MNCLKNSRSALSRLLQYKPAGRPLPPAPAPQELTTRNRTSPRSSEAIWLTRGLLHHKPAVCRPPPAQAPHRYFYNSPRRPEVIHFSRRRGGSRWYHDQRKVRAAVFISGGVAVAVYFGNLEAVPYTNRNHFILVSPAFEQKLGESQFNDLKKELAPKILSPLHPDSVRVRLIASEIVRAVHRGLAGHRRNEFLADDASYGDISTDHAIKSRDADVDAVMMRDSPRKEASEAGAAQRDEEILDDRWVTESRNRGKARGARPETRHLEGLNWEVIVVRDKIVNAMCLPGGKIVVFTGLLDHFRTDAEIATVLGHEIGHAIARHPAEIITKNMWFAILQIIILQFIYLPDLVNTMSTLLLRLPFSRRMEIEADHIGLLLLGAAGFDPRIAPSVYEKLGKISGDSALNNYLSTHPSSKKRSQLLSQAKVMEEAMELYREVRAGQGTEGFL